jgi:hypothetical protein
MKKVLLLASLFMPLLLPAQNTPGKKDKSIIIFLQPLQGQSDNLEKGLAHHNQTFHNGKDPIDVYEVLTGDETGELAFVYRNGYSWPDIESTTRSANEKEHSTDWRENVAKYAASDTRDFYATSDDSYLPSDLSALNTDLTAIYSIGIVPGKEKDFYAGIKKIKEMYQKNNSKDYFLVQSRIFGKGSQAMVIIPLANGWASFEPSPNDDWSKLFKKAFPNEDYQVWSKKFDATQQSFNSFVVKWRKDLSSSM